MGIEVLFIIAALIISIVLHEMAHGYAADALGDPTPRIQGRLTANPVAHLDPVGSVLIPAFLFLTNVGILFGWAKPVEYNPYNLTDQKYGEAKIAAAGPAMNICIAVLFGMLVRFAGPLELSVAVVEIASAVVYINILLALFNMIPVPPLDGSKILAALLPTRAAMQYREAMNRFASFGILGVGVFLMLFITVLWEPFAQLLSFIFTLITGTPGL